VRDVLGPFRTSRDTLTGAISRETRPQQRI
jgi:hypothetical protein